MSTSPDSFAWNQFRPYLLRKVFEVNALRFTHQTEEFALDEFFDL
jgi:hypothetical protein